MWECVQVANLFDGEWSLFLEKVENRLNSLFLFLGLDLFPSHFDYDYQHQKQFFFCGDESRKRSDTTLRVHATISNSQLKHRTKHCCVFLTPTECVRGRESEMCVRAMGCVEKEPVFIAVTEAVKWREGEGFIRRLEFESGPNGIRRISSIQFFPLLPLELLPHSFWSVSLLLCLLMANTSMERFSYFTFSPKFYHFSFFLFFQFMK